MVGINCAGFYPLDLTDNLDLIITSLDLMCSC